MNTASARPTNLQNQEQSQNQPQVRWGFRLTGLQGKLILPYVVLTLLLAVIGTYVITQLVTASVSERFVNQLYEASRSASDSFVRQERDLLDDLRLTVFTEGIPEALEQQDTQMIDDLLRPLISNRRMEIMTAVDLQGHELLTIGYDPSAGEYRVSEGTDFSGEPLIANVLKGVVDDQGDKFAGMIKLDQGWAMFTSAPVLNGEGKLTGVLMVGKYLDTILEEIKQQVQVDLVVLDPNHNVIDATISQPEEGFGPIQLLAKDVPLDGKAHHFDTEINKREYGIAFNPLMIRKEQAGWIGVFLSSNFVTTTETTSRNLFSLIFTIGTIAMIVIGYLLAQNIARPILRLRSMTQAVAAGDLNQTIDLKRSDEIGELAQAFDQMTLHLRERTEEAERLYAESLKRNKELAETNARLKETQLQLIQSEKLAAIGQLTAGIVHDVKNPFGVVMGMAEFLSEEQDIDQATLLHGLKVIRESAIKGNRIVSDLLKFARQSQPEMRVMDLRETVEASQRLTAYLTRRFDLEVSLPDQPIYAKYDAQQIEQVLINLIHNAVQAMPNGGSLRLRLKQEGDFALIEVQDTGSGIEPEKLQRIFDPFFTTKPEGEGTGLGLSVSYGIIANHHGKIEVESEVGKGSTFSITLPVFDFETIAGEAAA